MRWIVSVLLFLSLSIGTFAAGPDDEFVDIYNQILQAQNMETAGQSSLAAQHYRDALNSLKQLQAGNPSWNPAVVSFRLDFLNDKLTQLGKYLPPTNAAPAVAAPSSAQPEPASAPDQANALRAQIDALTASNAQLEEKLKEALSVQPSVSPAELASAQAKIDSLQKENDLLKVTLDQQKSAQTSNAAADALTKSLSAQLTAATNQITELNATVSGLQQKLADATNQLNTLQTAAQAAPKSDDIQKLTAERDHLQSELDQRTKDLADAEAHGAQLQAQAAQSQAAADAQAESARLSQEVDTLRARVAVLEASPVPYTADELAILKAPTAVSAAQGAPPPATNAPLATHAPVGATTAPAVKHGVPHSMKDLPPGAGALMADASRAAMERDFKGAEEKYNEVLSQDENNVYVLAHLAATEYEAGDLADCEKSVLRALALDPDDAPSLYLLGILRYRQERLDEALDALSHSAQLNSTNAGTQNYLGVVLSDKGQRAAAETAFRKALQVDPDYSDAHYNLAFVYATEKPPSLELARWHYRRALDLGHPKNDPLEKLLGLQQ